MNNQLLLRRRMMMQSKKDNILTFTADAANSSVQLTAVGAPSSVTLEYNLNNGGWLPYTIGNVISLPNVGDNVKMRGNNATFSTSANDYYQFVMTGYVAAGGDVTSLQNEIGGDITLSQYCYYYMFRNCTSLTEAPALPSTTLAERCYGTMFRGCTGLTTAPDLPATTLEDNCYSSMFRGCTGLTQAPSLPATTLEDNCYNYMFQGCTGLTQAPSLPATTLANSCYQSMFSGCTGITSYDVATLNDSSTAMFLNNSSCVSFTIHAETPPTIANNTITGLKADCIIYVPAASVDAYKAAQYWSARASYIQAIP